MDEFLSPERALVLARRWAACPDPDVRVDLEVTEVDGGYLVDVVAYRGRGPFERIGGTLALIDHAGRFHVLRAAV
jgi:hypothetical protein